MSDKSELLEGESDESCFLCFRCFSLLSRCLLFDFLYFLSSDESDSLDDESDDDGSDFRYSGTNYFCAFYLHFDNSVGSVCGLGSSIFVPTGVESRCDIFVFVVFVLIVVKSKGG